VPGLALPLVHRLLVGANKGDLVNVVFLSPHFPLNFYRFCVRLREAGANALGIADEPYDRLRPELRAALTEYYRVSDMHRYPELVRGLGYLTFKHGKLDRLDSMNEYWLETEARLREDFNIWGLKPADMPRMRRKSEMKKAFARAGIRSARGRVCPDAAATRAFVREIGYPVVAKPDVGMGASGTHKVHDERELDAYLAAVSPADTIVEEFVAGTIVTYDGLADRAGRVVFDASLQYSRGVMEVVIEDTDVWYHAVREIPRDIEAAGKTLVDAFEVRERFFHFEFFRLPDGGLVALEVNVRPPGGLTVDMWNYQNDIDMYREWANLIVKGRIEAQATRPYFCAYVGRKSRLAYAHGIDEVLARFGGLVEHHQTIDDVFSTAMGNYGFVLRSPDFAEIEGAAAFIQQRA
jgi:hypothetical protein